MKEYDKKIPFENGKYTELVQDFIKYTEKMGYQGGIPFQYYMRSICHQMNAYDNDIHGDLQLTKEMAEAIAKKKGNEAIGTQQNRIGRLRRLAAYIRERGYSAYVYPSVFIPKRDTGFKAYVFDRNQISTILKASDRIQGTRGFPNAGFVYPTMLRLLCCCGLRSSEVRKIKISHVDLEQGILFIEKSKNGASRYVPVSVSVQQCLKDYAREMSFAPDSGDYFFPSPRGGYLSATALVSICKNLFKQTEIPKLANGRYPRVHDFRHGYIVHALDEMVVNKGMDLYSALPILSAYVGHSSIKDTEYYIHLSPFHYAQITAAGDEVLCQVQGGKDQ